MDRSVVLSLISVSTIRDEYGRQIPTETKTDVYAQADSVSQAEFFEGGRIGLNPELKFTLFFGDYHDEPIVEYNGNRYSVYRTYYRRDDKVELYVERKGGTNAAPSP